MLALANIPGEVQCMHGLVLLGESSLASPCENVFDGRGGSFNVGTTLGVRAVCAFPSMAIGTREHQVFHSSLSYAIACGSSS